jgi:ATP-dependent helicase/nuclease subunit B
VSEVVEIFEEVNRWASKKFEELSGRQPSLLVLAEQAKRVCELLRAFPETEQHLSHLQLERIVKTIYEPSPVTFRPREVGFLPIVHHSSAVIDAVEELLWWDFSQNEADHFFARWYNQELNFLIQKQVFLSSPKQENERLLWQRPRAILQTQKRLVLVVSEMVNGTETQPHPLYSDIEATFKTPEALTFSLDDRTNDTLLKTFHIPKNERLNTRQLGRPKPYFNVADGSKIADRTEETYTSLETLLYYPYKWVFKYKLKLQNTSILSVVKDATLKRRVELGQGAVKKVGNKKNQRTTCARRCGFVDVRARTRKSGIYQPITLFDFCFNTTPSQQRLGNHRNRRTDGRRV